MIECLDVYDGDSYTLRIDVGFHLYTVVKVRLKGADTYELRGGTEETKELARKGRDFAQQWFEDRLPYCDVRIKTEKTDNFGRWLGDIYVVDRVAGLGLFQLSRALIDAGLTTGRYE